MKRDRKEPLYRKEKKTGLQTQYYVRKGGEARWARHTKTTMKEAEAEVSFKPMKKLKLDYDYTPLFMFLLKNVGKKWDDVYSEAKSRLDKVEPIWWMVIRDDNDKRDIVRIGEGAYYNALMIDENGILVKINPNAQPPYEMGCSCHTNSFNGKPYKYKAQ